MVPLIENDAFAGVLLTAAVLYGVFLAGLVRANPLTLILVIWFTPSPIRRSTWRPSRRPLRWASRRGKPAICLQP